MNKRFFCVVIALLCVLFSSCSRKRQVDSNRELEIINKGSKITLDEDAAVLCDQIETIVEDVCDYQSFLTTLLSDSEYDSYKKNVSASPIGGFVSSIFCNNDTVIQDPRL